MLWLKKRYFYVISVESNRTERRGTLSGTIKWRGNLEEVYWVCFERVCKNAKINPDHGIVRFWYFSRNRL